MPVRCGSSSSARAPSSPHTASLKSNATVVDIQGTWREEKTNTVWKVDGIVAKKHKQKSKAVVLSDSPNGVEWGEGNLIGSIEDGVLSWRNRAGKVMYEWQQEGLDSQPSNLKYALEPKSRPVVDSPSSHLKYALEPKSNPAPRKRGNDASMQKPVAPENEKKFSSPRSTASTASTAPTESAPFLMLGPLSYAGDRSISKQEHNTNHVKQQPTKEVEKLLEMAGSRLASGDYGTAMKYVLFAQTLHNNSRTGIN
jgi:hypothetical protein